MGFLSFIPVRIWAGAGLFVVLALGAWKLHHDGYQTGYKAGSAEIQGRWDKDVAAREKAWRGEINRQAKVSQEVERELREDLDDATATGRAAADRLLLYQRKLAAAELERAAARAIGNAGPPGVPGSPEAARSDYDEGFRELIVAGQRDAARLEACQNYVKGVIVRD